MSLSASTTLTIADQAALTASASAVVQPPAAGEATGNGRLVHPTLGVLDYFAGPDETVDIDGDVIWRPSLPHAQTISSGVDGFWPGNIRDVLVTECWKNGDVGCPIAHLRAVQAFFANPPGLDAPVVWSPSYANARSYRVIIADVRSGGKGYTLDRRLARDHAMAPQPVEVDLRILGYAD